jgi:hypothetical protein
LRGQDMYREWYHSSMHKQTCSCSWSAILMNNGSSNNEIFFCLLDRRSISIRRSLFFPDGAVRWTWLSGKHWIAKKPSKESPIPNWLMVSQISSGRYFSLILICVFPHSGLWEVVEQFSDSLILWLRWIWLLSY